MKYRNIIFDVGGVLLSYRWLGVIMETVKDREEAEAFAKRLYEDPLWLDFDIELRPFDDVVEDYVKKYPEDEEHIRYVLGHVERMPIPRERVWEKVHALKEHGYKLYLLSNYSSRMFHAHTDGLPFLDDIDGHIISFETHHLKPDKEIYDDLFEKYGLDPAECIFFDDRQENVDAGRRYGMEGRVIYTEETLLGYLDRLLAPDGISNKFHDASYSREERIDWLLSEMTLEEKIIMYSHPEQGAGRLGVEGFVLGGEASHGVEARNKDNGIGEPDITTSFPNPIGMSSSWDMELISEAGRITGTEARASFKRHRKTGLSRWAPTIDMERDPRWGRNEEGYGEDPYLTSRMASAYIRGLQGDDPEYIRCGATLKHYYANNVEKNRFFANSSIGLRDKYEYYLPPFMEAVKNAGALGVMTSYNRINGIPAMTDHEIKSLLKDGWGLTHAVSDGFAMMRLRDYNKEYGTTAECLAASVNAGVDCMNDKPEEVEKALRDALELSLLSEDELDGALRNILMAGMKLGIYDSPGTCPYDQISKDEADTEEARHVCRRLSEESLVLLENKENTLPLKLEDADDIAIAGALADEWYKDWYGGVPPFCHTVREGLSGLTGRELPYVKGLDTYRIYAKDRAWHTEDDGSVGLADDGDLFYIEEKGEGYVTIRSVSTGKYVQSVFYGAGEDALGDLRADKEDTFDWFTVCRFHMEENADGSICLKNRFSKPVTVTEDGRLKADDTLPSVRLRLEKVSDGIREALDFCEPYGKVILVTGCDPMIPAREDYDRTSLALPSGQQRLMDAFADSGKKVITVLLSNYPYTLNGAEKKTDALLLSATGSEYMGDAVAAALFGEISPAGRLPQGWPVSEDVLPDMDDYRIIGRRTYRYVSEGWLYPFGYGLSYGDIRYTGMKAHMDDEAGIISVCLNVENTGARTADEVVQIYAAALFTDERLTEAGYGRRLIAFRRIHALAPGETREISFAIDRKELRIYDAAADKYIFYGGTYHIYAGHDALTEAASCDIYAEGDSFDMRDLSLLTPVYSCDDYDNIEFVKGSFGMTAAMCRAGDSSDDTAELSFFKCRIPEKAEKAVIMVKSEKAGKAELIWNDKTAAKWNGDTASSEKPLTVYELPTEHTVMPEHRSAEWRFEECPLESCGYETTGTLKIKLSGDIRILSVKIC